MILRAVGFATLLSLSLAGCANLNTTGGLPGAAQNVTVFKVQSDVDYVYRAMTVTAMLSAVAEANPDVTRNAGNIKQVIAQVNGLNQSLQGLYAMATAYCGSPAYLKSKLAATSLDPSDSCLSSAYYRSRFEALTPEVDRQLINLAAVALKSDDYAELRKAIESGDLWTIASASFQTLTLFLRLDNAASGAIRQRMQEYALLHADPNDVAGLDDPIFYEQVLKLKPSAQKPKLPAQLHFISANFYSIAQNCLHVRSHLGMDDQRTASVTGSYYWDRSKPRAIIAQGLSINNCPDSFHLRTDELAASPPGFQTQELTLQTYAPETGGSLKGLNIGSQTSPAYCTSANAAMTAQGGNTAEFSCVPSVTPITVTPIP